MRSALVALMVAAAPLAAQQSSGSRLSVLQPSRSAAAAAMSTQADEPIYIPLRRGEAYVSGFLAHDAMVFGNVLGPVRPPQVSSHRSGAMMTRGEIVAVRPPEGTTYAPGDTIVLAVRRDGPKGWGDIVVPTGLARVGTSDGRQTLATLLTVYGPVRRGQDVYRLEPFVDRGEVIPVAVAGGVRGRILGHRDRREMAQSGSFLFIDVGRVDGMRPGDFVEIRRQPQARLNAADTIDELMGVAQVVHVGEHSSTIRVFALTSPDIATGSLVVRVAALPD